MAHLEEMGLIKIKIIDKRSKKVFGLTRKGKFFLKKIKNDNFEEKIFIFKNLILEIFSKKIVIDKLIFEIINETKKTAKVEDKKIEKILKEALIKLKKINK